MQTKSVGTSFNAKGNGDHWHMGQEMGFNILSSGEEACYIVRTMPAESAVLEDGSVGKTV